VTSQLPTTLQETLGDASVARYRGAEMSHHFSPGHIARSVAALGAAVLVMTSCTPSQASLDGCAQAIEVVRHGEPAARQERAWATLPSCGAAGALAARDAWTSLRSVSDSARIARAYDGMRSFRDSSVFAAARTLLLDSAATPEARVSSAMLVVAQLVERADPDYHVFSTTGAHDVCAMARATEQPPRYGAPLPPNARALAESTALGVLATAGAPQSVRHAARCTYDAVNRDDGVLVEMTSTPSDAAHLSESAGRLDSVRVASAVIAPPRARRRLRPKLRQRVDSMRGVVDWSGGGGCVMQQPSLQTSAGKRVRLDGSRDISQLLGREVVVFGRETDPSRHSLAVPYPLFSVDSFFVRSYEGRRVHDGILRRGPRGDVLEMRDGRRLPVANLPSALEKANGMRVWIAEPLGTSTIAGTIDPSFRQECTE